MLNQSKGNMYGFVTHTFNVIKGKCFHDCSYCYMKRFKQNPLHMEEKEFKTDLGSANFIFVGSSVDMFAKDVPDAWISRVLEFCTKFDNKYLFQSKDPERMFKFFQEFPKDTLWATTVESNRPVPGCNAPIPAERVSLKKFPFSRRMVTIEPVMDFDTDELVKIVREISPEWVNIGADSNARKTLPEPSKEKLLDLIAKLSEFTTIKNKNNLSRLLK